MNGPHALDCRKDASLEPSAKISMTIDPYYQWYDGRGSVVEQLKCVTFYRMQRHFSDSLSSNVTKTGNFERRMWVFNVRKLHRPRT